ncbi:mucin-binding protein [Pediococcus sp. M21F004]|uniref:mucin-binding protein n=1 Tax=Pediococcus sp. M21F004 TaxID=3390033 RepID=UPI003DA74C24
MGKNNRLGQASKVSEHFKMYKDGKTWVFAGLAMLSLGIGLANPAKDVHADENTPPVTNAASVNSSADSKEEVSAVSGTSSEADVNSSADPATKTAVSSEATSSVSESATVSSATEKSSASSSTAPSATAQSSASNFAAPSATVQSSAASNSVATVSDAVSSGTANKKADANVTNLVNPTSTELNNTKSEAESTYLATGQAQVVTATKATVPIDTNSQSYKNGYAQASYDIVEKKRLASTANNVGVAGSITLVPGGYTTLRNLYGLGKVYEAGRIANGVDTSKDVHLDISPETVGNSVLLPYPQVHVDISKITKTDIPYGIDISDPKAWWVDSVDVDNNFLGFGGTDNAPDHLDDVNYQAGYQAYIKLWAKAQDAYFEALGAGLKDNLALYANSIAYNKDAVSGSNMPADVLGIASNAFNSALASNDKKNIWTIYQNAATAAMKTVQDVNSPNYVAGDANSNAVKAISDTLWQLNQAFAAYIPMFQPAIQSYMEKAILGNPVSLGGQNDWDVQFLNDGTTFADITYTIMNGYAYQDLGALATQIGDVPFASIFFSQYITNIYTSIRNTIERADYIAGIDGENDYLHDLLQNKTAFDPSTSLTNLKTTIVEGKDLLSDHNGGKLALFTDNHDAKDTTKLAHDGFYMTTATYLNNSTENIKQAAFQAAISGKTQDVSQFLLTKTNTMVKNLNSAGKSQSATVVLDNKGNEYSDYSDNLTDTNALIKSVYDAEYQAVQKAMADYKADPTTAGKKSYKIVYTQYSDNSYSSKWVLDTDSTVAPGTFTWTSPVSMNDTKNWYTPHIGESTISSYNSPGKNDTGGSIYTSYSLDVSDYNNMFNYLVATTPASATITYVTKDGKTVDSPKSIFGQISDSAVKYVIAAPSGFEVDDPNYPNYKVGDTISISLTDDDTDNRTIQVVAIIYSPNNPGDITGTGVTYLTGKADEKITYAAGNGATENDLPVNTSVATTDPLYGTHTFATASANIYRTAHLDNDGTVVYANWTTNASGTATANDVVADSAVIAAYKPAAKPGYSQLVTGTTVNDVAAVEPNADITAASFGNERATNPVDNNPVPGDDNEYLGKETEELFNIVRTIALSTDRIVQNEDVKVSQTIHYTGAGTATPGDFPQTVTYQVVTNETTGKVSWTPQGGYGAVTSPKVLGYSPDQVTVKSVSPNAVILNIGEAPKNTVITVTYTENETVTVEPTNPKNPNTPIDPGNPDGPKYPEGVTGEDLNKTVSRTITYSVVVDPVLPTVTTPGMVTQTGDYTRNAIVDAKTGEFLRYGEWMLSVNNDTNNNNDGFTAVISPKLAGYTADKNAGVVSLTDTQVDKFVAASQDVKVVYSSNGGTIVQPTDPKDPTQPIDPNNPDGPKYPEGVIESDLNKTISREIAYNVVVDSDLPSVTTPEPIKQTGKYVRTAIVDSKTGELLGYGDWTLSENSDEDQTNDGFTAVTSPKLTGYSADKNATAVTLSNAEVDKFVAASQDVQVQYTSNGTVIVEPSDPKDPTDPTDPVDPTDPEGPKYLEGVTESDLNKTISREIAYNVVVDSDLPSVTTPEPIKQTGKYVRTAIVDSKTGELLGYGDWTLSENSDEDQTNDGFTAVTSPKLTGYSADKNVAAVALSNAEVDKFVAASQDVQVQYTSNGTVIVEPSDPKDPTDPVDPTDPEGPKYPEGVTESDLNKTVSRTITYKVVVDPDLPSVTTPRTVTQTGKYTRTATVDGKTGELLGYSAWVLTANSDDNHNNDGLIAVTNPKISGYTADKTVNDIKLTDSDITGFKAASQDVLVTYTSNGGVIVEPTDPKDPTTPIDPTDPEGPKYPEGVDEKDLNKMVSREIIYKGAGSATPKAVTQTASYGRTAVVDSKTGELLGYGDWVLSTNNDGNDNNDGFKAVTSPKVYGYVADKNASAIDLTDEDVSNFKANSDDVVVTYTRDGDLEITEPTDPTQPVDPNNPEGPKLPVITADDLNQTVTRTITYTIKSSNDPNAPAAPEKVIQSTKYKRSALVDKVTGELLGYTEWTVNGVNGFAGVDSPKIQNYLASLASISAIELSSGEVEAIHTNGNGLNELVTYTFTGTSTPPKDPNGGVKEPEGNQNVDGDGNDEQPVSGNDTSSHIGDNANTGNVSIVKTSTVKGDVTKQNTNSNKQKLPQTDESSDSFLYTIGMLILGLTGLLGIGRKRRHEDEK